MKFEPLLVLPLLLTAACAAPTAPGAGSGDPSTVSTMQDAQTALKAPTGPPKYGGMIVVPSPEGPKTMNPYFSAGVPMSHVGRPVFDNLVELYQPTPDYDGHRGSARVEPMLAERWEMPDNKTVLFHLRRGVKFHNGDTFDADDVVHSFEYARDPKNAFPARTSYSNMDKIEKVGSYTVRITLKQPDVEFMRRLTNYDTYVLSKDFLESGGDPNRMPVGTGPFRQTKFDSNVEAIAVKNEDFWNKGKPYLDAVRVPFGLDRSAILAAFATKKIDSYNVTDKIQFDEFQRQVPDLRYYVYHGGYNYGWYPNVSRPPLSDVRVRRAMQLAIDRQAVNDAVMFGAGLIEMPGSSGGSLREVGIPYEQLIKMPGWRQPKDPDIAEAKRLLAEAGYPNGVKLKGPYISTFTTVPQIVEVTATQLKSVGIDIEIMPMDANLWFDAVRNKGDFDVTIGSSFIAYSPDAKLSEYFYSKGSFNKAGINDPKLDELIIRAKTIPDETERRKMYAEIGKILMDQAYYMATADTAYFGIVQPWVNNLYGNFAAQSQLRKPAEVWLDVDQMPQDRRAAPR